MADMCVWYEVWGRPQGQVDPRLLFRFPAESWGAGPCWEAVEQVFADSADEVTIKRIEAR